MNASLRRGFTLVELLIVAGLIASLLGLVAAGVRPSGASQVRQLSQSLSSAILATQTRALGNDTGSALILDVSTGAVSTNTVFNGDVPPFATGAVSTGMPPTPLSSTSGTVALSLSNADPADLATGYKIRFFGTSPPLPKSCWFGFSSDGSTSSGVVSLRTAAGQTIHNTVWPQAPGLSSLQFEIARYPIKSSPAADVTKLAAIDLRYSGVGDTLTGSYSVFNGNGSIGITFDRNGGLDSVILYGSPSVAPINPTAPLYLLIANANDIQANRALQSQTSRWLAIAPGTGRVSVAMNVAVSGTTASDIANARSLARQGVTAGVK